ncbi:MAG TPA: choice-of-anchor Q domain-containing protein [Myxococcota bacterium]|nr:choice-of-anchor Q domain-containing protein [Myxococcota bacterium]
MSNCHTIRSLLAAAILLAVPAALVACGDSTDPTTDTNEEDSITDTLSNPDSVADTNPGDDALPDQGDEGSDSAIADSSFNDAGDGLADDIAIDTAEQDLPDAGCLDSDGDGYGPGCASGPDCAPDDATRFRQMSLYRDRDFDGFGSLEAVQVCVGGNTPAGFADDGTDPDDNAPSVFPGAPEVPDDGKANDGEGEDLKAATATNALYVVAGSSDDNDGSRATPLGTIGKALVVAQAGGIDDIFISRDSFSESITLFDGVRLHGGYDEATWTRAANQFSRITGTTGVTVTVEDAVVALDGLEIRGSDDEVLVQANPDVTALSLKNSTATMFNDVVAGSSVALGAPSAQALTVTGIRVEGSQLHMNGCRVGDGGPMVSVYGGTGPVSQGIESQGILLVSGSVRSIGGTLGFGASMTLSDFSGSAAGSVKARGILVQGGNGILVGVDIGGGIEANVEDVSESGTVAVADAAVDGAGAEITDNGSLWLVNCLINGGLNKTFAEVYAQGTAEQPVEARGNATTSGVPVLATGGTMYMAHCDLYTENFSEAVADVSTTFGTKTPSTSLAMHLIQVREPATAKIVNSAGYSMVNSEKSSLISLEGLGHMTMLNSVWWDKGYEVCRVTNGVECLIPDGGLDSLAQLSGCDRASGNLIQDQLWGWWDSVNPGSPLLDGGINPESEGIGVFIDRASNARPKGESWDIGAYEFN